MELEKTRRKNLLEYIYITKLFTFLIFSFAMIAEYLKHTDYTFFNPNNFDITPIMIYILVMALTTVLWVFSMKAAKSNINHAPICVIENIITMILFTVLVAVAPDVPQYKLLFLLTIITSSLQHGFRHGFIISVFSSIIVIVIDLFYLTDNSVNENFQGDLIILGVYLLTAWLIGYYEKNESENRERMTQLAIVDGLTDVYNHRYFYDSLKKAIDEADGSKVSLLFVDIDYFKFYNDMHGHQEGDKVLRQIAYLLKKYTRPQDIVCRYGGEEFAIILKNTGEKDAVTVAERIRKTIERTPFDGEEYQPNGQITVSIGVSTYPDKAANGTELVKSTDDALYRAKFFNKNRVEIYHSIFHELKNELDDKDKTLLASIKTLISVINAKDRYTYGHMERVVMLSQLLGEHLKLSDEDKKILKYSAYLHDIGKINIPEEILNKKMPLTEEEWNLLKLHPSNGVAIIQSVEGLSNLEPIILHHHESYDGKGYPFGLKGTEIPFLARVITVVDSFDAMTSDRVYRKKKTLEEAIEELKRCKGTQFDPEITDAFIEMLEKKELSRYMNETVPVYHPSAGT